MGSANNDTSQPGMPNESPNVAAARPPGRTTASIPPGVIDADGVIAVDLPCRHCDYNLRGLHREGRCPECGKDIAESLAPELLRFAPPHYVRSVRDGVVFLLIPIALLLFSTIAGGATIVSTGTGGYMGVQVAGSFSVLIILCAIVSVFLLFVGAALVTTNPPQGSDSRPAQQYRRVVHAFMTTAVGLLLIVGLIGLGALAAIWPSDAIVAVAFPVVALVLWGIVTFGVVAVGAYFMLLGAIARRIPDYDRERDAGVLGCGFVLFLGAGWLALSITAASRGYIDNPGPACIGWFALVGAPICGGWALVLHEQLCRKLSHQLTLAKRCAAAGEARAGGGPSTTGRGAEGSTDGT